MSAAPAPGPAGATPLAARIRELANEIVDPCSAAQAIQVGMADMGLLLGVDEAPAADPGAAAAGQVDVTLRLRVTAPGCFYVVFFERELRARIEPLPEVASLALHWDDAWDWTPDEIAPHVREQLAQRRQQLRLAALPGAGCE